MSSAAARQIAKLVAAQNLARFESGVAASTSRLYQTSASSAAPPSSLLGPPTLVNTPVRLNSTKWAGPTAVDTSAMSIFDVRGAFDTLSKPPDTREMSAGMVALNARVARAQQQSATLAGFKVFPDLTPGRALMWGTILAFWGVATGTALAARALDIHSLEDLPGKMKKHLEPVKAWGKNTLSFIPQTFTVKDTETINDVHAFASSVKRNLTHGRQMHEA